MTPLVLADAYVDVARGGGVPAAKQTRAILRLVVQLVPAVAGIARARELIACIEVRRAAGWLPTGGVYTLAAAALVHVRSEPGAVDDESVVGIAADAEPEVVAAASADVDGRAPQVAGGGRGRERWCGSDGAQQDHESEQGCKKTLQRDGDCAFLIRLRGGEGVGRDEFVAAHGVSFRRGFRALPYLLRPIVVSAKLQNCVRLSDSHSYVLPVAQARLSETRWANSRIIKDAVLRRATVANATQNEAPIEVKRTENFAEEEDLEAQLAYQNLKKRREARKRKRIIIGILVAAAVLAGAVYYFVTQAQQAAEADAELDPMALTTTVTKGDFTTSITANGATEPLNSTVVTPEVDGIIEGIQVGVGQQVNQGDVLFTVKNDKLDVEVRDKQDQLISDERSRDRKNADIDKANRAVDEAYAARQDAWNKANESGDWDEYDEASLNAAITSAEEQRESAYSDRDDADAIVEKSRIELAEARAEADKRTVRAPVTGVIISMTAKEGAKTSGADEGGSGGGPLMQIVDLSQMKVTVQVNEVDIAAIHEGQKAVATFAALPDVSLDAEVTRIASISSGSGEDGAGGGGVVTYAVDLLIPEPDKALKPGMTATVTITTQSVPDTLIVSAAAVGEDESGAYVTVVDDAEKGETHRADVEIVAQNGSDAAIKGEVEDGDVVLLDPTGYEGLGGGESEGEKDDHFPEDFDGEVVEEEAHSVASENGSADSEAAEGQKGWSESMDSDE